MGDSITTKEGYEAMLDRKGVFGFGFSLNSNLDMMNLVVLAIVKLFIFLLSKSLFICMFNISLNVF